MFTGLVQALGRIENIDQDEPGCRFTITWPALEEPLIIGESVAISGCCLTVVSTDNQQFDVELGPETLRRTNLGKKKIGDLLNLERSLRSTDRLGGHFVQGHVDTTAILQQRSEAGEWSFFKFRVDPGWTALMVPKGSIAVDGVSLTLVEVWADGFSVMLIPHTLAATTLGLLSPTDLANIETDMLAKHVQRLLGTLLSNTAN
jgi:riboflavin synthase